jgi:hypothetical protein
VGSGVLFDGAPLTPREPPPLLGEHNAAVGELVASWRATQPVPVPRTPDDAVMEGATE